jgi:hypothetical protein
MSAWLEWKKKRTGPRRSKKCRLSELLPKPASRVRERSPVPSASSRRYCAAGWQAVPAGSRPEKGARGSLRKRFVSSVGRGSLDQNRRTELPDQGISHGAGHLGGRARESNIMKAYEYCRLQSARSDRSVSGSVRNKQRGGRSRCPISSTTKKL